MDPKKPTNNNMLSILDTTRVSPPPATIGYKSLPLTFFDAVWLLCFPIHQLFFYEFPYPRSYFLQTLVNKLKHSLSVTLQHYWPFAGKLVLFPHGKTPEIRHVEGDSVALTFAECDLDFNELVGYHPRECNKFYQLVPLLGQASKVDNYVALPVFSVQVTLFPDKGIAIGLTNHHSLCDASTRFNFLEAWTSITRHGSDELFLAKGTLPLYERVCKYPQHLDEVYFNQPGLEVIDEGYEATKLDPETDKVRATVVLTLAHINRLKKWVRTQLPTLEYVSSFSVACAYVWSCVAKSLARIGVQKSDDDLERFMCAVDWRSRLDPPLPKNYFGNCVGPCFGAPTKSTLLAGNKGFLIAAEVFGKALSETIKNKDALKTEAYTWLERAFDPIPTIGVSGTPKINVYDVDFGWGKPKKHETLAIDYNGSISVNASKDSPTDIEIGISLPAKQMDAFISISRDELALYDQD